MNPGDRPESAAVSVPVDIMAMPAATPKAMATVPITTPLRLMRERKAFIADPLQLKLLPKTLIPRSWIVAGMPVFEQDHLPDLVGREMLFPRRHHGGPGERFTRQSDSSLRHPPEHKGFLKLRDCARIREIRRDRIECKGKHPAAVQIVAVTPMAILEEDLAAFTDILQIRRRLLVPRIPVLVLVLNLVGILTIVINPERARRGLKHNGLAVHFCARGRCRVHRA